MFESNGVRIAWTPYDPLDLASTSIDPLGFGASYVALADLLLPGLTTITTVPRYLSVLCAAVAAAEELVPLGRDSVPRVRRQRLDVVKSFERAWALACVLASEGEAGKTAANGIRGIRSINRRLQTDPSKGIRTDSFALLADQGRYGMLGVYSSLAESCHLVTLSTVSLRDAGRALAETFPAPEEMDVTNEKAVLDRGALARWGSVANPGAPLAKRESRALADALKGGPLPDGQDLLRWTSLQVLASVGEVAPRGELAVLREVRRYGRNPTLRGATYPERLPAVAAAALLTEPFEEFYQAALFVFQSLLQAATDVGEPQLGKVAKSPPIGEALETVRSGREALRQKLESAAKLDEKTVADARSALEQSRILSFAAELEKASSAREVIDIVLRRHRDVQSGKIERGLPKSAWVQVLSDGERFRLTAQKFGIPAGQRAARWKDVTRHSYRTGSAYAFIRAAGIG